MKDEIKEILQEIIDDIYQSGEYTYQAKKLEKVLDYITNLQQRCEYLERSNNRREDEIMSLRDECVDGETYKYTPEKGFELVGDDNE